MLATEGGRYNGSTSNAYTPNMARPGKRSPNNRRTLLKVILCVLIPPIGILVLWRTSSFRLRGRVLVSLLSAISMTLMILSTMQRPVFTSIVPAPSAPLSATHAPETDTVTALSNIEELLLAQEAAEAAQLGDGEIAPPQEAVVDDSGPTDDEIWETIVYCVNNGAKYFHVESVCQTQSNTRQLTVRQAVSEFLGACSRCNPPVPQ